MDVLERAKKIFEEQPKIELLECKKCGLVLGKVGAMTVRSKEQKTCRCYKLSPTTHANVIKYGREYQTFKNGQTIYAAR